MIFEGLLDAVEPIKRSGRGRPRRRPEKLCTPNKAYDDKKCRGALRRRGIKSCIARKGIESSEKLGRHRWVVERTLGCGFRSTAGSRSATSAGTTFMRRLSILVAH
jgi:hypothetical protein